MAWKPPISGGAPPSEASGGTTPGKVTRRRRGSSRSYTPETEQVEEVPEPVEPSKSVTDIGKMYTGPGTGPGTPTDPFMSRVVSGAPSAPGRAPPSMEGFREIESRLSMQSQRLAAERERSAAGVGFTGAAYTRDRTSQVDFTTAPPADIYERGHVIDIEKKTDPLKPMEEITFESMYPSVADVDPTAEYPHRIKSEYETVYDTKGDRLTAVEDPITEFLPSTEEIGTYFLEHHPGVTERAVGVSEDILENIREYERPGVEEREAQIDIQREKYSSTAPLTGLKKPDDTHIPGPIEETIMFAGGSAIGAYEGIRENPVKTAAMVAAGILLPGAVAGVTGVAGAVPIIGGVLARVGVPVAMGVTTVLYGADVVRRVDAPVPTGDVKRVSISKKEYIKSYYQQYGIVPELDPNMAYDFYIDVPTERVPTEYERGKVFGEIAGTEILPLGLGAGISSIKPPTASVIGKFKPTDPMSRFLEPFKKDTISKSKESFETKVQELMGGRPAGRVRYLEDAKTRTKRIEKEKSTETLAQQFERLKLEAEQDIVTLLQKSTIVEGGPSSRVRYLEDAKTRSRRIERERTTETLAQQFERLKTKDVVLKEDAALLERIAANKLPTKAVEPAVELRVVKKPPVETLQEKWAIRERMLEEHATKEGYTATDTGQKIIHKTKQVQEEIKVVQLVEKPLAQIVKAKIKTEKKYSTKQDTAAKTQHELLLRMDAAQKHKHIVIGRSKTRGLLVQDTKIVDTIMTDAIHTQVSPTTIKQVSTPAISEIMKATQKAIPSIRYPGMTEVSKQLQAHPRIIKMKPGDKHRKQIHRTLKETQDYAWNLANPIASLKALMGGTKKTTKKKRRSK